MHMYEDGLQRCNANYTPLIPLGFLCRGSEVYGDKTSVRSVKRTWRHASTRRVRVSASPDECSAWRYGCSDAPNNISGRKNISGIETQGQFALSLGETRMGGLF